MRKFAETWTDEEFVQQVVAQIPWKTNLLLLDKLKDEETRKWYANKIIENGWSSNVTRFQIDSILKQRTGNEVSNFPASLPPIGILLVRGKNETVVKYSLEGYVNPIGVSDWQNSLSDSIPKELQDKLPTIEEIEKELEEKNDGES